MINKKIKEASKPFQETLRHHKIDEQFIEERKIQLDMSNDQLNEMKQDIELYRKERETATETYNNNIATIMEYCQSFENELSLFKNFLSQKESLFNSFCESDEKITAIQEEHDEFVLTFFSFFFE